MSIDPDSATPEAAGETQEPRRRFKPWQESLLLLAIAVVLAIVVKALFVQAFYIPSGSMEPGLVDNDRILVEKPSYWAGGQPQRGDVVVFTDPGGWLPPAEDQGPGNPVTSVLSRIGLYPTGGHLVKRVIAVAGDTVVCCDDQGRISVNGRPLDEAAYVKDDPASACNGPMVSFSRCSWSAGPVPEGHIFVMGDNRDHSADSTVHLCTPEVTDCSDSPYVSDDLVVGKVVSLIWPLSRFHVLHRPVDFADVSDAP